MKLSAREIELISDIGNSRKRRRRGAWIGFCAVLIVWLVLSYFDVLSVSYAVVVGIFLGTAVTNFASAYSTVQVDDKLVDILQRYVNNDPEALHQLSSLQKATT